MIILLIFLSSSFLIPNSNNITEIDRDFDSFSQTPLLADDSPILFEGNENALNITDYGNLYEYDQEASVTNQEDLNLSYYLDDENDWKVSKVETQIKDIKDTRNWINNSGFQPVQIFRKDQVFESFHDYDNIRTAYDNPEHEIIESGAYYMRVHFVNMSFDYQTDATDSDFMVVYNGSYCEVLAASGFREDFFSPWSIGETIFLSYEAKVGNRDYGYYIDYYEIINASSNLEVNSVNWKEKYAQSGTYGSNTYGSGSIGGADGMFIGYHGSWYGDLETFVFFENTFTELYQENIVVPRGKVLDAYLSFDYYTQFALDTNNIMMYMKINGEKVYSKGLLDLNTEGKNTWHHTYNVPMYLWINQTNIFTSGDINEQTLNISIGIRNVGASTSYSGYDDGNANLIWFDNVSLAISTLANSTQDGINLKINTIDLIEENEWGKANLNLTEGWDTDPIILNFSTTSPSLSFNLNTILFGNHSTKSRIDQSINEGISYKILENGTIYWEFYHNLYMPSEYSDFEFIINKPTNWEFIYALDPKLQSRLFENGALGDLDLKINKTNALFSGWWLFKATSPNYLDIVNTKMLKQGEWTHTSFDTGESTRIKTQVNYSGEIPSNIESTEVNLTIFDPEGHQWYSEIKSPLSNGTVLFSETTFAALNTTGGQFEYTLFWSNGTALGGLKSSFIVNHQSQIELLKPDDAKIDLKSDGFVGDIISIRIILTDPENGLLISGANISCNWAGGTTHNFTETAIGIYETTLDTADLFSRGLYEILISSSKLGFIESNLTLEINLGEEFDLVWIIIIISALIISALGVLSLRSYVILPRRRIKEAELLARTQRFKDLENIQAVVAIHRYSGIPLYSKSYSILEKQKKELFSGFIQAIITVGEEMAGKRERDEDLDEKDSSRTILELDFKYFYCLICDRQDLRVIFILTERASDRLKKVISDLSLGAMLELSEQLANWDGAIHEFELMFPPIINKYVELSFKETFKINNVKFIAKLRKESELNSMETRILNVLYSIAKSKTEFYLESIFNIIHEKNRDIVIDSIETLIQKKVIIPSTK